MDRSELRHFLDADGRLLSWPSKPAKQLAALRYLANRFSWDRDYTEREVNEILDQAHVFGDSALLRRELYMKRFLGREKDGSRYWRTMRQLPPLWRTERLIVSDAKEEDVPVMQKIHDACSYVSEWTGLRDTKEHQMLAEFHAEELPPDGKKELHRLQTITFGKTKEIVGFLTVYHGFPDRETLWIGDFAIHPDAQRNGFGREVIDACKKHAAELGWPRAGIGVLVGNEPGLKFWASCGFTEVVKREAHGTHTTLRIVQDLA